MAASPHLPAPLACVPVSAANWRSAPRIFFTSAFRLRQREDVRRFAIVSLFSAWATACFAQNQEQSLVDRLLWPNMELQNKAQGKKFGTSLSGTSHLGTVGTFYLAPARKEKSFAETRTVASKEYRARSFENDAALSSSVQNRDANLPGQITTSSARNIRETHDAHSEVLTRSFAGQRTFPEQGKSQKSLDRQNPPLTIDQVRELLNKNR